MAVKLRPDEVRRLLSKLCVDLGFCLAPEDIARLQREPPVEIQAFADAVFVAEGLDPRTADRHLWRQVRDVVAGAFALHNDA